MKKTIFMAALCAALIWASIPAVSAESTTATQELELDIQPNWQWSITAQGTLNDNGIMTLPVTISPQNGDKIVLGKGTVINISMNSANNFFLVNSDSSSSIEYEVWNSSNEKLSNGATVLEYRYNPEESSGDSLSEKSETLSVKTIGTAQYAGKYTDSLTFNATVTTDTTQSTENISAQQEPAPQEKSTYTVTLNTEDETINSSLYCKINKYERCVADLLAAKVCTLEDVQTIEFYYKEPESSENNVQWYISSVKLGDNEIATIDKDNITSQEQTITSDTTFFIQEITTNSAEQSESEN